MEVLTTRLRLRPELAGRRSPVRDGGDVEEEGGREGGGIKIKIWIHAFVHLVGRDGLLARSQGLDVSSRMQRILVLGLLYSSFSSLSLSVVFFI